MDTALLIIDVQRALTSGEYEAFESRRVIDRINHVLHLAHDAGALVVFIQHEDPGGPLAHGSEGWQLDADLAAMPADIRVRKTTPDSFHNTELQDVLRARGITKLVVCGLQSEFCVDSTTRSALSRGYPVTLVADGHSTMDNGVLTAQQISAHHNQTLRNVDSYGPRARVIPAAEVRIDA
jgi:nicotinamidase-related amidase